MIEENISIVIPKPDSKTKTLDQMKQKRKDAMDRKSQKKKKNIDKNILKKPSDLIAIISHC